jgi:hypothetical protein
LPAELLEHLQEPKRDEMGLPGWEDPFKEPGDTERGGRVTGGGDGDLGGAGEPVAALPDGAVEDELLHLDVPHGVRTLLLRRLRTQQQTKITASDSREATGMRKGRSGKRKSATMAGDSSASATAAGRETVVYYWRRGRMGRVAARG